MNRISALLLVLVSAQVSAVAAMQATPPILPVNLEQIVEDAAAKVGVVPTKVIDAPLGGGRNAEYENFTVFGVVVKSKITVDVNQIAFDFKTGPALKTFLEWVVIHELMHQAGYAGDDDGKSETTPTPPTEEDCEHFRLQLEQIFFLCEALAGWQGPTDPYTKKVQADYCRAIKRERDMWEAHRHKFITCGTLTDVDVDGDGVTDSQEYIYPEYVMPGYTMAELNLSKPLSKCPVFCP